MSLDVGTLATTMLQAAEGPLAKQWGVVKTYARTEFTKLAHTLVLIEQLKSSGQITPDEAATQLAIQRNAAQAVFLAVQGLTAIAVQQALTAGLNAVKGIVNGALGFTLI